MLRSVSCYDGPLMAVVPLELAIASSPRSVYMNHRKHYQLWAPHLGSHEAMPTRTNADTALTLSGEAPVWWQLPVLGRFTTKNGLTSELKTGNCTKNAR